MRPLKNPCVLAWSDAAWAVRRDGSSQGGYLVALADGDALLNREFQLNWISWQSGKLPRVARSSSAAEVQAAGIAQEEMEYVRLVWFEVLNGQFPLSSWMDCCATIPGALIMDCKGVFDALRSESSGLGMKDKRSALEALALRRAMTSTNTVLKWCHSGAQLADVMTKDSPKARQAYDLLSQRKSWKLVFDPEFTSEKNRRKQGLQGVLDEHVHASELERATERVDDAWSLLPPEAPEPAEPELMAQDSHSRNKRLLQQMRAR